MRGLQNDKMSTSKTIYIDPSYRAFDSGGLFDLSNPTLNRDDQLLPFHRLREIWASRGVSVCTANQLFAEPGTDAHHSAYYSLGIADNFERVLSARLARLAAFVIMEPPVVAPHLYAILPRLTEVFERVYVHNAEGDGYSLSGVNENRLHRFYWPIPYRDVLLPHWDNRRRLNRIVVINGNHNPRGRRREQYSLRIKAMSELSNSGIVDLYGRGWDRWWSRAAMWWPYWRNRGPLMAIYKGPCESKFEVLANYEFCLCFENMRMNGYITEKLFDCLYAGTIPLYLGAPDIVRYMPPEVFVDCRNYSTWTEMWLSVADMSSERIQAMRQAGRQFLHSDLALKFYDSMLNVCAE